ncbi:MAG TPA: type II toxin-antitoxin system RelE/ParE family toxin [Verrucomicrobiae bacterium]|nr:type II toxin-antitoxin system RelE/ParE family toxin [Verrucomicrobiae bacterium]
MTYAVAIHAPAKKSLLRLSENIRTRVARSMLALAENPRPPGSVKLSGRDAWRIRVGDYRVIYTIDDSEKEVVIFAIGHRREIYR